MYYIILSKLPNSTFPLGSFFNYLRIGFAKKIIRIGNGCKLQNNVYFGDGKNISIGNNCQINDNIRLDNVLIGNHVMIARDCIFLGKMHNFSNLDTPMINQGASISQPTLIEDDVWIGARVIVMPGVKISRGTIVGAGAVLTKDTVENGIYGGVPAKLLKKRI